jgi:ankyrin repeat protein
MYLFGKAASGPSMASGELKANAYQQMHEACSSSNYSKILSLIEQAKQADKDIADLDNSSTPFMDSLYESQLSRLVNEGEPILIASAKARFDIVWQLLENGANPNVKDEHGKTMMRFLVELACSNKTEYYYIRQVKCLLESSKKYPIQLDFADEKGITPLMYAILEQHDAMRHELERHGAKLSDENRMILESKLIEKGRISAPQR